MTLGFWIFHNFEPQENQNALVNLFCWVKIFQVPEYIIGDAGYPIMPNLMIPFYNCTITKEMKNYNYRLNSTRMCVEGHLDVSNVRGDYSEGY